MIRIYYPPRIGKLESCVVCIVHEKFDVVLYESTVRSAVEIYFNQALPLVGEKLEIKPLSEVRRLKEEFISTDVCVKISV